uniref:Uncharacterized protein n=1 Tax=Meloidogyne javanica TaxID=6303 RepID=A0A915MAC9_MELJA
MIFFNSQALSNKEERNNLIELINYTKIMKLIKNLKNKIKEKRENKLIIEEEEENIFLKEIKEELEKYEKEEEELKEKIEKEKEIEIEEIKKDEKEIVKEEDLIINERKEKLSNLGKRVVKNLQSSFELETIIEENSNENADNIEEILELLKENFINKWVKENNKKYQHYLLVICAYSPDSLGGPSLCDVIESHLTFLLIKKFETLKFIKYFHINPKALFKRENCPKAAGIKEEDWKCTGWIIGFKILKEEEIKENIEELKNKIKSLKENDFKKYIDKNGEEGKIKIGASYLNKKKFKEFIAA